MSASLDAADQALATTTAALLEAAAVLRIWQLFALGLAAWQAVHAEASPWLLGATMLLGAWGCVLQLRLALDARVLRDVASGHLQPEDFDRHLALLGLAHPPAGRNMVRRCAGAMRLWRWLLLVTLCQSVWVVAVAVWARCTS